MPSPFVQYHRGLFTPIPLHIHIMRIRIDITHIPIIMVGIGVVTGTNRDKHFSGVALEPRPRQDGIPQVGQKILNLSAFRIRSERALGSKEQIEWHRCFITSIASLADFTIFTRPFVLLHLIYFSSQKCYKVI